MGPWCVRARAIVRVRSCVVQSGYSARPRDGQAGMGCLPSARGGDESDVATGISHEATRVHTREIWWRAAQHDGRVGERRVAGHVSRGEGGEAYTCVSDFSRCRATTRGQSAQRVAK